MHTTGIVHVHVDIRIYTHRGRYSDLLPYLVLSSDPLIKSFLNNLCNFTAITFPSQLIIMSKTRPILIEEIFK